MIIEIDYTKKPDAFPGTLIIPPLYSGIRRVDTAHIKWINPLTEHCKHAPAYSAMLSPEKMCDAYLLLALLEGLRLNPNELPDECKQGHFFFALQSMFSLGKAGQGEQEQQMMLCIYFLHTRWTWGRYRYTPDPLLMDEKCYSLYVAE